MLKRNMCDQLFNTCSLGPSEITGYTTNVQVGDINHIFYNTLYGSKSRKMIPETTFLYLMQYQTVY